MTDPPPTTGLSPAAELFAEFVERAEAGEDVDFEAFCSAHSEHDARLRRLHGNWQKLGGPLLEVDADPSEREELAELRRDPPGSTRLEVRREVARGGSGRVLEAWDRDMQRGLAMKVLLEPEGAVGPDARSLSRFLEEAQVTGQLDHPGIVPVHELGLDASGRVYYTMPLIRGESFGAVIERVHRGDPQWSRTRALGVLLRVCEAMAYAHSRQVVHRDLKPTNVMVGPFGETYVIDWGLARVAGQDPERGGDAVRSHRRTTATDTPDSALLTADGDVVGTPAYMAPEQARGELARVGPQVDVYALGALLYELLSGAAPFEGDDQLDVLEKVRRTRPRPIHDVVGDVPPQLAAICERAMAAEPTDRYAGTAELAEDLRAFLELRVVSAYKVGALAELSSWVRRNRALAVASAAAVLTLVAGLATSLFLFFVADQRAQDVLRLSSLRDYQRLRAEAAQLWPATLEHEAAYESWIARARELVNDLPAHRAVRDELRARLASAPGGVVDEQEDWWAEQLELLIDGLEDIADPETGLLNGLRAGEEGWSITRRLEIARETDEVARSGARAVERWEEAALLARDLYDDLVLVPQVGLLPIGEDPVSGLLEFWVVGSGDEPRRDPGGSLDPADETGIVLVLLPGGSFRMGSQSVDPQMPGYDELAHGSESPVHEVTLDPFFIGKHEVTQGQWRFFNGVNPSGYQAGGPDPRNPITWRHPVEKVSWYQSVEYGRRLGLTLPTEAQWEYACRAGTTTPFATGTERLSLEGYANIADEGTARTWSIDWNYEKDFFDGWAGTSPAGAYLPNDFGLHDMLGNVFEWCLDTHGRYELPYEPGTGLRLTSPDTPDTADIVYRGGSYYATASNARSARRMGASRDANGDDSGLRLARAFVRSTGDG